jgi:hypothetical protein
MKRVRATAALLALALGAAGCGSDEEGSSEAVDPFTEIEQESTQPAQQRAAAPRWEELVTRSGSGPDAVAFTVAPGAIQWRARWSCESESLTLTASGREGQRSIAEAPCPDEGTAEGFRTGEQELGVRTPGRWRVVVEQQIDTPIDEPPLEEMEADDARVIARGDFYEIDRRGEGTASLYRLGNDRLALRLTGFETAAEDDLFVWLSRASRPRTTVEAEAKTHTVLRSLKSSAGNQNYLLPEGFDTQDLQSIVIWCEPVQQAYTAATLRRE